MTKVTHLTLDERGELSRKRIHLREISGDADTPLETVGQDLRAARLRRGDDLATVSRALKIRKDHLEALEEDRFEALPGRTYAVGFVRSYSDYLGLDPLQCVERFKSEIAGRTDVQPTVGPPPDADTVRLPQGWVIIGIVVLVLVLYGAYHLARSADSLLRQPVAAVPAQIAPPPAAATHATSRRIAATALSPTGGRSSTAGGPPVASAALQGNPGQAAVPAAGTAPLPAGRAYGMQNHNPRVVLRAHVATRVLVQGGDGTVYLNRTLQPGDTFNVPNRVGLTLSTPNGSAIAVELDGQLMGYAAPGAQMTEALSLDPQAIVDHYNHGNSG